MQVDVLMAVQPEQVRDAVVTLTSLVLDADVELRLAIHMHGASRQHFGELDRFVSAGEVHDQETDQTKKMAWRIHHTSKKLTFTGELNELADMMKNKLAVLAQPCFAIDDPKWFGKLQRPFTVDRHAMLAIVMPFGNISMPPTKPLPRIDAVGPLMMGGADLPAMLKGCLRGKENFALDLREWIKKAGGQRWMVESIRHVILEPQCPARLEEKTAAPFE